MPECPECGDWWSPESADVEDEMEREGIMDDLGVCPECFDYESDVEDDDGED